MGYETKLIIGKSTSLSTDECAEGDLILKDGQAYHPVLKDENGEHIKTGRQETYFQTIATIDLCKCGNSEINGIERTNPNKDHFWYWYDGDEEKKEDCYGAMLKPIPITDVIAALKIDSKNDDYRRLKWALALLESMQDDPEGITVLIYGH